jgi:tetratricopeptide (TPR) repeat protein
MARAQVNLHDVTAAQLFTSLIQRCEENPEKLGAQLLQARATLVEHYQKIGETAKAEQALDQAAESFWTVIRLCDTKKHSVLEAAISLSKLHVEASRYDAAENMFQKVASEAEIAFGTDDDCTIDILIAIGVFYQEQGRWQDAQEYFEQALSLAMVAYGVESEPTRRLEMALERQRYVVHFPTCEEFEDGLRKRWPRQREEVVRRVRLIIQD